MAVGTRTVRGAVALLAGGAIVLLVVLFSLSSAGSASGTGPAGATPTPVYDLTGVVCMDLYLDQTDPPPVKGEPHHPDDLLSGKILSRIEPSASQQDAWDVTSVAYTGPGDLIPEKPPSDGTCKQKEDGNELNFSVDLLPVSNDRPTAIAKLVQKGAERNLEYVICQVEDLPVLGEVWVRSEFVIVVDGVPASQDFGVLTAYLEVSQPNDIEDPLDTSCGTDGPVFNVILEATQRVATKGAPQPGVADNWDGDGCSDWHELGTDERTGGLRDPLNPNDFFDPVGPGGSPPDGVIDLPNDILGVLLRWTPAPFFPYDHLYDRGPVLGPNAWNKDKADGIIDLSNDILGVIFQWQHNCAAEPN